jgi:hypothetical protein
MFWGCISHHGVGTLTLVDGNINTEKYISILDEFMACNRSALCIFQEDNTPCHVSATANEWKTDNGI